MAASGLLHDRDLRALTAVVEDGLRDDPGPAMPWAVLDHLLQLVPCEGVGLTEYDLRQLRPLTLQSVEEGGERSIECGFADDLEPPYPEYWTHRRGFVPNSYVERSGDTVSVLRWSDFYSTSELRSAPFYAEFLRPMDHTHGLYLPLPTGPGRSGGWCSHGNLDLTSASMSC